MTNPIQSEERRQQIVEKLSAFADEHEAIGAPVPVWIIDYIAIQDDQHTKLLKAVDWVLHDAAFKAPEQIGMVAERWLDRLESAMRE